MTGVFLPDIDDILRIHARQIARFGGAGGVRDPDGIAAAIGRGEHLMAYAEPSVVDVAAAVSASLIRRHCFVDGNKRIGFAVLHFILGAHDLRLDVTERDAAETVRRLAASEIDEDAYTAWVAANVTAWPEAP